MLIFLFYLLACSLAAFHEGMDKRFIYNPKGPESAIRLNWSLDKIISTQGDADLNQYAKNGKSLAENGNLLQYYSNFWPPGMPATIAVVILCSGEDYYVFKMVLLNVVIWSFSLFLSLVLLSKGKRNLLLSLMIPTLFLLPQFREFNFGYGSIMSESISSGFFVLSLSALVAFFMNRSKKILTIAAAALAGATYYRFYYGFVGNFLFGGGAILCFSFSWIRRIFKARKYIFGLGNITIPSISDGHIDKFFRETGIRLLLGFFLFLLFLLPWSLHRLSTPGHNSLTWHGLGDKYIFGMQWVEDSKVPSWRFSQNIGYKVDPKLGNIINENLEKLEGRHIKYFTYMTLITNPVKWLYYKIVDFCYYWMGVSWDTAFKTHISIAIEGVLIFGFGVAGFVACFYHGFIRGYNDCLALLFLLISFSVCNILVSSVTSYEWRYSVGSRIFAFLAPIFFAAIYQAHAEEKDSPGFYDESEKLENEIGSIQKENDTNGHHT